MRCDICKAEADYEVVEELDGFAWQLCTYHYALRKQAEADFRRDHPVDAG